jgi:hypothetical protein|tara:strand:- start:203 stop:382 length:180 start_codon:yes stop_codon:yes gene_type:complete
MRNKYKEKIKEYLASYKYQLKFAPKYKDKKYSPNPVYYNLMGKIELAEKLLIDLDVRKK